MLSTSTGTTILDPDSYGGFGAKIEDFNYRLLGLRQMPASVHAEHSPETPCPSDNDRTICPENWELRQLYVIEATLKPSLMPRKIARNANTIPKRILYIDSEAWIITASDQYDNDGALWKTLAIFNAYRDRGMPTAREAVYPFNRMIQTAIVDEDIRTGFSTVSYLPGKESEEREGWYIDPGAAPQSSSATSAIVESSSRNHASGSDRAITLVLRTRGTNRDSLRTIKSAERAADLADWGRITFASSCEDQNFDGDSLGSESENKILRNSDGAVRSAAPVPNTSTMGACAV
jgi:hypothetical protein